MENLDNTLSAIRDLINNDEDSSDDAVNNVFRNTEDDGEVLELREVILKNGKTIDVDQYKNMPYKADVKIRDILSSFFSTINIINLIKKR